MKKSSYQKLKEENLKLKRQLIVISTIPKSLTAMNIMAEWRIRNDLDKSIMAGDCTLFKKDEYENKTINVL